MNLAKEGETPLKWHCREGGGGLWLRLPAQLTHPAVNCVGEAHVLIAFAAFN